MSEHRLTHITADLLREHHACKDQVALFEETFGKKAKIGPRNWAKAIKAGLCVGFLECLLPPPARAEYMRVADAAWSEYKRVADAAWSEYKRVAHAAWSEYKRVAAPALAEYKRVRDAALLSALMGELS